MLRLPLGVAMSCAMPEDRSSSGLVIECSSETGDNGEESIALHKADYKWTMSILQDPVYRGRKVADGP